MLKRRYKRRYLAVVYGSQKCGFDQRSVFDLIVKRSSELFGQIFGQMSYMRLIKGKEDKMMIISCKAERIDQILVAITMVNPPLIVLDISGSIRKLVRRTSNELCSIPP